MYDLVIIGAGPAGLTAGIYAGRSGLNTIILDENQSGGTVNVAPLIENYPGINEIPGVDLARSMTEQAKKYVDIREFSLVESISKSIGGTFEIKTTNDIIDTRYILIATGSSYKTLDCVGVDEFVGRGVSYCAVCDGTFFVKKEVLVICSLVHRRDKLRCDSQLEKDLHNANIKIYWNTQLKSVNGNNFLEEAVLYNNETGDETKVKVSGIFIAIGYTPNNKLIKDFGISCDDLGYIEVDENMKTSVDGIYAAGDITGGVKQVIVAAGQAAQAVTHISELLLI